MPAFPAAIATPISLSSQASAGLFHATSSRSRPVQMQSQASAVFPCHKPPATPPLFDLLLLEIRSALIIRYSYCPVFGLGYCLLYSQPHVDLRLPRIFHIVFT
jgi:hypothetical protein